MNQLLTKTDHCLCRCWLSQGARYVGFLGQTRPLAYNDQTNGSSPSVLPYDITEGPTLAWSTDSARQRQSENIHSRLHCPLVVDNRRWPQNTAEDEDGPHVEQKADSPAKSKFFESLIKPSVSIAYHHGRIWKFYRRQGIIYGGG